DEASADDVQLALDPGELVRALRAGQRPEGARGEALRALPDGGPRARAALLLRRPERPVALLVGQPMRGEHPGVVVNTRDRLARMRPPDAPDHLEREPLTHGGT